MLEVGMEETGEQVGKLLDLLWLFLVEAVGKAVGQSLAIGI